jgi:phosphate transport system permease protein
MFTVGGPAMAARPLAVNRRRRGHGDGWFRTLAYASAFLILALAALFLVALIVPAVPAFQRFGLPFLWRQEWDPVHSRFGALPYLYGTLLTSAIALVLALPIGLGAALFLAETGRAGALRTSLSFAIELLAGIPSVVVGLWALFMLAPFMAQVIEPALIRTLGSLPAFSGPVSGTSFLTAGIVLAIMILPILVALSRDVIRAVPRDLREASLALGATTTETTWSVVLPYARAGITGAVLLALGRALGETIAVTMVIGNAPRVIARLFSPGYTLASVLANEFSEAGHLHKAALFELGLILILITIVVNVLARLLVWRFGGRAGVRL